MCEGIPGSDQLNIVVIDLSNGVPADFQEQLRRACSDRRKGIVVQFKGAGAMLRHEPLPAPPLPPVGDLVNGVIGTDWATGEDFTPPRLVRGSSLKPKYSAVDTAQKQQTWWQRLCRRRPGEGR